MLDEILVNPAVYAIGWALVAFTWQAAVIGAAAALALRALSGLDARWRYALACTALLTMLVLPALTMLDSLDDSATGSAASGLPILVSKAPALPDSLSITESGEVPSGAGTYEPARDWNAWLPFVVMGWLAGVVVLSVRLAGGWLLVRRMMGEGTPVGEELAASVSLLALRLHLMRPVRALESKLVDTPTVIGWLRPVVLLPLSAMAGLSPEQVEAVIAHELAHISRHDYAVNFLQRIAETLFFFHPAVWWLSGRIRLERERCADDVAVAACGDATLYVAALRDLEEGRSQAALALGATGGSLRARAARLLGEPPARERWAPAWIAVLGAALVCAVGLGDPGSTTASTEQRPARIDPTPALYAAEPVFSVAPGIVENTKSTEQRTEDAAVPFSEPQSDETTGESAPATDAEERDTLPRSFAPGAGGIGAVVSGPPSLPPQPAPIVTVPFLSREGANYTAALEGGQPQVMFGENFAPRLTQGSTYMGLVISDGVDRGATVESVEPDSPAASAGIQAGDVITELDGVRVVGARQFTRMVQETPAGRTVPVTILRNNEAMVLDVVLTERQGVLSHTLQGFDVGVISKTNDALRAFSTLSPVDLGRVDHLNLTLFGNTLRLGIEVDDMTPQLREYFGAAPDAGVLVAAVDEDSPAATAGLAVGDVIIAAGGNPVRTRADLTWSGQLDGDELALKIVRDHSERDVTVRLEIPPRSWRIAP